MGIKKQIGLAMATTALGAMLIAGGSYALFTSTASNTGNTFTSGTVVIQDITGGTGTAALSLTNLAPGDSGTVNVVIKNNGTLDAYVAFDSVANKTGGLFGGTTPVEITVPAAAQKLAPGASGTFAVSYSFPLLADNSYQGATGGFDVKFKAVQAKNNENGSEPISW